jgi:hypothetical protein
MRAPIIYLVEDEKCEQAKKKKETEQDRADNGVHGYVPLLPNARNTTGKRGHS